MTTFHVWISFLISFSIVASAPAKASKSLKILVVGGIDNNGNFLTDVEFLNPFMSTNTCKKKQDFPANPNNPYPKAYDNCGSEYTFTGGIYRDDPFELVKDEWVERSHLGYERYRSTCGHLSNGSFMVLGGLDSNGFDYRTIQSTEIMIDPKSPFMISPNLPEEMADHCMAKVNETHFFIAGSSFTQNTAYLIDTSQNEFIFTKLPLMKQDRYGSACGSWIDTPTGQNEEQDLFLILAGASYHAAATSEIFSMKNNEWFKGPDLPREVQAGGYYSDEQHPLIIVGGRDELGIEQSSIIAYQSDTNSFEVLPSKLKIGRWRAAVSGVYDNEDC